VIRELRKLSGTESVVLEDEEMLDMVLPAIRNDYGAVGSYEYTPGPALTCPITVLVGDEDPRVTPCEARAWSGHTTGDFSLRTFAGGHFYLIPRRDEVTSALREFLEV
jgi:pyochelin biosynthetic protein PchC